VVTIHENLSIQPESLITIQISVRDLEFDGRADDCIPDTGNEQDGNVNAELTQHDMD